ncbi:MAG: hypothetical protein ACM3PP_11015, partial [Candidatus Saccharibacteria bacterium]
MSDRQSATRDVVYKTLLFYIPVELIFWLLIPVLLGRFDASIFIKMGIMGLVGGVVLAAQHIKLTQKRFIDRDSDFVLILKEEIQKHELYGFIRSYRTRSILLSTVSSAIIAGPLPTVVLNILDPSTWMISIICMGAAGAVSSWLNADYV